ncbi:DedA family protein [Candidatus Berkiella cookevillensis]|uniref:DedA family protein n=1 Tax=Candidatus Berkiella cookevillensis TaxID=437022 RepID=A0A0Q9YSY5_9GAMM|nr:YqaA family protein [Candidatus Berkiella cookevillensis]MCS5708387.1 DedA family protein [Candidatus Berkiella cookevillensis]
MFSYLYGKVISWAKHQYAPYYLVGVSFAESSVFPIPPDVMLIPMVLGKPLRAWHYALITTIASVMGGVLGYLIGYFAFETIHHSFIVEFGYEAKYQQVVNWFDRHGWLAIAVAGSITPIPYKLFTIAAGAVKMPLWSFVIASMIGRASRFFLVAGLVKSLGKTLEERLLKYVDRIGWGFVILGLIIYIGYYVFKN